MVGRALEMKPGHAAALCARLPRDARIYQIAFQAILLTVGVLARDFALDPRQMALAFAAGLVTQRLWLKALGLEHRGMLSALITCFGVSLLLRSDTLWVHPLAAAVAMSSKFVLRVHGKHIFNPANLGVIAALVLLPGTWVSPGQWGNDVALAGWFVALGGLVTQRARRWDISWVFLGAWLGLVAARVLVLGQPWTILAHQLANGGLAAVRVLHDFGSADNSQQEVGAHRLCDPRRDDRIRLAVRAFPDQRAPVGALYCGARCSAHRLAMARSKIPVAPAQAPEAAEAPQPAFEDHSSSCLRDLRNSVARCCCSVGGAGS